MHPNWAHYRMLILQSRKHDPIHHQAEDVGPELEHETFGDEGA